MAILIKNDEAINKMRVAGKIVGRTLEEIEKYVKIGTSTYEIDQIVEDLIRTKNAVPSFLGYNGFPGSACTSVNESVCHGIPSKKMILKDGDIIKIDIGAYIDGFHGDACRTFMVGNVSDEARRLVELTKESFFVGAKYATKEHRLHEISGAIHDFADDNNLSVVREFIGHGIGKKLHEAPEVPHYRCKTKGPRLEKGMTFCIEPMLNLGKKELYVLDDGWTSVTADGSLSAQYENTVLITDGEPEFLTLL